MENNVISKKLESEMGNLVEAFDSVSAKVAIGYHVAHDEVEKAVSKAGRFIKKNPLLVSVASLGIGMAIGRYLISKSNRS